MEATPSPDLSNCKRRQLDARSLSWIVLFALLTIVALMGVVSFPSDFQNAQCPPSTFKHRQLYQGAGPLLGGIFVGMTSIAIFFASFLERHHLLSYSGDTQHAPVGKYNTTHILVTTLGILISGAVFVNGANFYYCMTATHIVIRRGYFRSTKQLTWDDVNTVRAWCSTETPRKAAPYKGATLKLSFTDGEELLVGLTSGAQVLMQEDEDIQKALKNINYHYYMNSTVNPDSCPTGLYPLLWNWRIE